MTFNASGFFGLRTPLLPYEALDGLSLDLSAATAPDTAADRALVCARLRELARHPDIREALFVASPAFDSAIEGWLDDPASPETSGVPAAFYRYIARMAGRPTPFGLFSGCSAGSLGAATVLDVGERRQYRRHTRLDMGYLAKLCEALQRDPRIRDGVTYRRSTALYSAGGKWRFLEARDDPDKAVRGYSLVAFEPSEDLDTLLERVEVGARRTELVERLLQCDRDLLRADAEAFVDDVIESGIVVSDLAPTVTGGDPLESMVALLRERGEPAAEVLAAVNDRLHELDGALGQPTARYREIAASLGTLAAAPDVSHLYHADLYKPAATARLGTGVLRQMEAAIGVVAALTPVQRDDSLRHFRAAFIERYGEQPSGAGAVRRLVSLAEVLDEDAGIGFPFASGDVAEPTPLLEGLEFNDDAVPSVPFGPREEWLLAGVCEAIRAGAMEWSLSDIDLANLSARVPAELPDALAVYGTVAAASAEALERGDFRLFVPMVRGPSGVELLGRFCHGDAELRRGVEAHLRAEEALRPDAIFAEVVHLPEGRLGNVLSRPLLRHWEIPFLGASGADREHQIDIRDLSVTVAADRVVLWCERLGCEVLPRLTTAHNFGRESAGIFRFLCSLQREREGRALQWSWGLLETAPFLPRITRGRIVLSLARWTLSREELAPLAGASAEASFRAVQAMRERRGLPRWVCMADTLLPVDLDNVVAVEAWSHLVKRRAGACLIERFPEPADLIARGADGHFAHELIVPFVRRGAAPGPVAHGASSPPASVRQRSFPPGSEWLYAKLYTGTGSADDVLENVVAPLLESTRAIVDRWFFIRYGDPGWHLRVRFHGEPDRLLGTLLPRLHDACAPLLADGRIWRVQLDTYERETERYGGADAIELVESLFEADSEAGLAIVRAVGEAAAERRGKVALLGSHRLLVDLGLDLAARTAIWRSLRSAYGAEHHVDAAFERQLGKKLRAERASLEALLAVPAGDEDPCHVALAERSRRFQPVVRELDTRMRAGRVGVSWSHLAANLVHMYCNRVLRGEHRAQELVIYDWLLRLSESESARQRAR